MFQEINYGAVAVTGILSLVIGFLWMAVIWKKPYQELMYGFEKKETEQPSAFEHTLQVEQALAVLEQTGIDKDRILVVTMDCEQENQKSKRTIRAEDIKAKAFEVGMAVATGFSVIGASVGFTLKWGPIVWGLIFAVIGLAIGIGSICLYNLCRNQPTAVRLPRRPFPELTLVVQCCESKTEEVRQIFWQYRAISVGEALEPSLQE